MMVAMLTKEMDPNKAELGKTIHLCDPKSGYKGFVAVVILVALVPLTHKITRIVLLSCLQPHLLISICLSSLSTKFNNFL